MLYFNVVSIGDVVNIRYIFHPIHPAWLFWWSCCPHHGGAGKKSVEAHFLHWLSACVSHIVVFPHIVFIYERQPHKFRRLQILIESLHERKGLFLQLYLCWNDNVGHYRHDLTSCQPWEWRSSKRCQHGQPLFSLCGGLLLKWWVTWNHVLSWNTGHHGLLARTWLPT